MVEIEINTDHPKIMNKRLMFFLIFIISTQVIFPASPTTQFKKLSSGITVILNADYPDPTIVKDGDDYYMTNSSLDNYPGLLIWHSQNLVDWTRLTYALHKDVGVVWAPDMIKYNGLFYIYFPAEAYIYVITAKKPAGPWSDPKKIDGIRGIDPGHLVGRDGKRYLYLNDGRIVPLTPDGLSVSGSDMKIYDGWTFSDSYGVECFCLESPKSLFYNDYFYMVSAEGGTSGPATSHMAVVARSKSEFGPYINSPYNPLIKTWRANEQWRSKGHATIFEGPQGKLYALYHAYENGHLPMGRGTLIEPILFTKDGWFKSALKNPEKAESFFTHNVRPVNDDFSNYKLNLQWAFSDVNTYQSSQLNDGQLVMQCDNKKEIGLFVKMCDKNFEAQFKIVPDIDLEVGLVIYYSSMYYAGMKMKNGKLWGVYKNNKQFGDMKEAINAMYFKINVQNYTVNVSSSIDGKLWIPYPNAYDVSGYQANVLGDYSALKIAVLGKGNGKVLIDDFKYKVLE